ncbi:hypothetical protein BS50DRAFT_406089 [Corynespora cassiicola Philippines]|uniref:Uncharacterized protein n=1 Tax=Corynespora cassiicola Philippines TaxID=1448308 RepID=A0A2T2NKW4_CORCC|nr:hypothetical protein BS50DRAFT_406089 [Corynespora cassiicola Philippines]
MLKARAQASSRPRLVMHSVVRRAALTPPKETEARRTTGVRGCVVCDAWDALEMLDTDSDMALRLRPLPCCHAGTLICGQSVTSLPTLPHCHTATQTWLPLGAARAVGSSLSCVCVRIECVCLSTMDGGMAHGLDGGRLAIGRVRLDCVSTRQPASKFDGVGVAAKRTSTMRQQQLCRLPNWPGRTLLSGPPSPDGDKTHAP